MRIAVSVAHDAVNPGATNEEITEYQASMDISTRLVNILSINGHEVHLVACGSLTRKIAEINAINADIGIEIHLNAYNTQTIGCETLHANSPHGKLLAKLIQKTFVGNGYKDRGDKVGYYRGDPERGLVAILKETNCPFVISEPLFMDSKHDFESYNPLFIAMVIADGIEVYDNTVVV